MQVEEVKSVITDAVKLIDRRQFRKPGSYDFEVTRRALELRRDTYSQTADNSIASRTLMAVPIRATVLKIELEENTQRYLITFKADSQEEGKEVVETIRSDRLDSWYGDMVRQMWDGLEGEHVCIYKCMEQTNDPKKPKVRTAPFVERIPQRKAHR